MGPSSHSHRKSEIKVNALSRGILVFRRSISASSEMESGNDIVSRAVSSQVPSAHGGLTSVFGMGTGGTLQPLSPEIMYGAFRHLLILHSTISASYVSHLPLRLSALLPASSSSASFASPLRIRPLTSASFRTLKTTQSNKF